MAHDIWTISWYDMPSRFVKYAQSKDFFEEYIKRNPYVANALSVNNNIGSKLEDFKNKTIQQLNKLSNETLQQIACSFFSI
jgi:hypothetical protein